jgi:hypothetical protein
VIPQNINPEPRTLNPLRAALTSLTVFLLASAIGCGLWYGKNWALTGNPTYPLLYDVFGGKTWNPDKDRQWNKAHRAQDFSPKLLGRDLGSVLLTSELHSPLVIPLALLAFLPFCAFPKGTDPFSPTTASAQCMENRDSPPLAASRRLRWGLLAYVIFFIAAWWLLTHRIDRFWLPVLPVLALLAGVGAYWNREVWWRRMLAALLLGGLAANFLLSASGSGNSWFIPLEQLRDDSKWIDPWHRYLNKDSILGGVLTVGDAAVFDLKAPVLYNTCFDDSVFEQLVKGKTAKEIQAELAARNIVYVYVNWDDVARYRDTYGFTDYVQPEVFDRLVLRGVLEPMIHRKGLPAQIYRVKQ